MGGSPGDRYGTGGVKYPRMLDLSFPFPPPLNFSCSLVYTIMKGDRYGRETKPGANKELAEYPCW